MELVYDKTNFFPFHPENLKYLPLEKFDCIKNKYIVEKFLAINGNYISKTEEYPYLDFKGKEQNIQNEYLLKLNKCFEIGGEFLTLPRKRMNILVIMNKNEQKIKDMNSLLFYIFNTNLSKEDSISVTIIMCSYTFITDYKPNCLFHDKSYYFYSDYCSQNKENFENFMKYKLPKFKTYHLNLYEIEEVKTLNNLNILPTMLPQFIFYDKNLKIVYCDNLFQETPKRLEEISKKINIFLNSPYNPKKTVNFNYKNVKKVKSAFYCLQKHFKNENMLIQKDEFEKLKKELKEKCLSNEFNDKGRSCKIYFVTKYSDLDINFNLTENSKILYIQPIIQNNGDFSPLPSFLFGYKYIRYHKKFHNFINIYLDYSLSSAKSFIENNKMKCGINFKTKKFFSNCYFSEKRELNVEYYEGFENYYVPLNFKILFRDKTKYFNINLYPKIKLLDNNKILFKDINDKDKEFFINKNEITILHYFREDLFIYQYCIGEKIKNLKNLYPNVKFRYCIIILIPCDKLKNSIYLQGITNFYKSCQEVDEFLFFTYVNSDFKELTKIVSNGPFIYIYDQNRKMSFMELYAGEKKKVEEEVGERIKKILCEKWCFKLDKEKYNKVKELRNEILGYNHLNDKEPIFEFELIKKQLLNVEKECSNYKCIIYKFGQDDKLKEKLKELKEKLVSIIGKEAEKINFE